MKVFRMLLTMGVVLSGWITSNAQVAEPEVPGDHFSLEGALELFKDASSPEEFEKMLNSPDSKVNNLDLNGDGYIDYIRVVDRYEGSVHAFILQAVISERETQDVAVIELEKLSNGKAVLQIVGDEDVYGVTTIIEPTREVRTYAGARSAPTVVNVWAWPSVQYVYGPSYSVWVSPWGWHRRPVWYRTWRPISYVHYYPIWRPYRPYYSFCHTRRVVYAREIYRPYRTTSVIVVNRHRDQLTRYRNDYRNGRTRDDGRRAYADNNRSSNVNTSDRRREDIRSSGRSSGQREAVSNSSRSVARDRTLSGDLRNNNELRRTQSSGRSTTLPNNGEVRRDATRPSQANRTRTIERPAVEQRSPSASRERTAPIDMRRNSGNVQRSSAPAMREANRPTSIQRRSPSSAPAARPSIQQRSAPAARPTVQQRSAPRQQASPAPSSRTMRQPASRPSMSNNRSSGSPKIQQRSSGRSTGATRAPEIRRGRQ